METTIIETQIVLTVPDQELAPSIISSLCEGFQGFFAKAEEWRQKALSINVTSADQKGEMKMARLTRLELKGIRVEAEKTRKRLKEDSLRYGRAVDGVNNLLVAAIVPLENHLEAQEKYGERLEAERIAKLRDERLAALTPFGYVHTSGDLGALKDEEFAVLLRDTKDLHDMRIERERKAEEERLAAEVAAAQERERLRLDNERLLREMAEREAAAKLEREQAAKEKAEAEAKAKAEKAALEAAAAAERAKAEQERRKAEEDAARERHEARKAKEQAEAYAAEQQRLAESKLLTERLEREKLEAEIAAREEKERVAAAAKLAAEKKAARAPDKAKALAFAGQVRAMQFPALTTAEGKVLAAEISAKVEAFAVWIEGRAATL